MNRKGITPVISVVLLLMMTVAVAGIAWFWITGMSNTLLEEKAGAAISTEVGRLGFDIEIIDYDFTCNVTDSVTKSANDARGIRNFTLNLLAHASGISKKELDTISIKAISIDGKLVASGDYLAGSEDKTLTSGEINQIVIKNGDLDTESKYLGNLKVNETDQDATADNPIHWEDIEILFTTDKETAIRRTIRMDANKKCI